MTRYETTQQPQLRRFLFIDEDEDQAARTWDAIKRLGCRHSASFAFTGREALRILARYPFAGIVTDWQLPDMTAVRLLGEADLELPCGILCEPRHQEDAERTMRNLPQIRRVQVKNERFLDLALAAFCNDWRESAGLPVLQIDHATMLREIRRRG